MKIHYELLQIYIQKLIYIYNNEFNVWIKLMGYIVHFQY